MLFQILTNQSEVIGLYPTEKGGLERASFPTGISSVKLPDIKQLNLKFRMKDSSTYDFMAVPRIPAYMLEPKNPFKR